MMLKLYWITLEKQINTPGIIWPFLYIQKIVFHAKYAVSPTHTSCSLIRSQLQMLQYHWTNLAFQSTSMGSNLTCKLLLILLTSSLLFSIIRHGKQRKGQGLVYQGSYSLKDTSLPLNVLFYTRLNAKEDKAEIHIMRRDVGDDSPEQNTYPYGLDILCELLVAIQICFLVFFL